MKKILSLLLAAMMLLAIPALAEEAPATQTITTADGLYTFEVPADFITINVQVMQETYTDFTQRSAGYQYGLTGTEMLTQGADYVTPENTVMAGSIDGKHTLRLSSIEPFATPAELLELKPWMDALVTRLYTDAGVAQEDIHPMEVRIAGGLQWYVVQIDLVGAQMHIAIISDGQRMYELYIISPDDQLFWQVEGSLAPVVPAVSTQTITSPDGSYTFEVPADYNPISPVTLRLQMQNPERLQMIADVMGADPDRLAEVIDAVQMSNMVYVFTEDYQGSLNVQCAPIPLTMEQVVTHKLLLDQQFIDEYVAVGVPAEALYPMDIQLIGTRQWYAMGVELGGQTLRQMLTVEDGMQYLFTFGNMDEAAMVAVLESFTIVAQ